MEAQAISLLEKGDILCRSRTTPMTVKIIRKVREIYSSCRAFLDADYRKDTPLILAARLGLANIVWGFIVCAKQSDHIAYGDPTFGGGLESFLGHKDWCGNMALHVAAAYSRVDVIKELLFHASWEQFLSCKNATGWTPFSHLADKPEFDEIVFEFLKSKRNTKGSLTIISIDEEQQESRCYIDERILVFHNRNSHEYKNRESLRKLHDGRCEHNLFNDTILHHVVALDDIEYAKVVIEKHSSLMYHRNYCGEIPAFVAAVQGKLDIFRMMINYLKRKHVDKEIESLMTREFEEKNALHLAIENHHVGVVCWLIKEVPGLVNRLDGNKISPLYIAAKNGYPFIVRLLSGNCKELNQVEPQGPLGTTLHAAASKGSIDCIQYLLHANDRLLYERNVRNFIPLDEAVFHGRLLAVKELLNRDRSTAYQIIHKEENYISTIHIAAMRSHNEILEFLISECPGCVDVTNCQKKNILHVVMENLNLEAAELIFQQKSLTVLINQKDMYGNTPMHMLVEGVTDLNKLDITKFLTDPRVDLSITNYESKTAIDMACSEEVRMTLVKAISKDKSKWKVNKAYISREARYQLKMMDQIVLVAAFIATASFAAAFAIPGGFESNERSEKGTPILLQRSAYKAFVVANALAFTCSCSVFFENIKMLMGPYSRNRVVDENLNLIHGRVSAMHMLIGIAMAAMVIAFVMGTYIMLTPSLCFAISICSTGLIIVVSTSLFARKIGGLVHKISY